MNDTTLYQRAMKALDLSGRALAMQVLGVNEHTGHAWRRGNRPLHPSARRLLEFVVARPRDAARFYLRTTEK